VQAEDEAAFAQEGARSLRNAVGTPPIPVPSTGLVPGTADLMMAARAAQDTLHQDGLPSPVMPLPPGYAPPTTPCAAPGSQPRSCMGGTRRTSASRDAWSSIASTSRARCWTSPQDASLPRPAAADRPQRCSDAVNPRGMSDASSIFDVMTAEIWQPLPARERGVSTSFREDVPPALAGALREWINMVARDYPSLVRRVCVRLELTLDYEIDAPDYELLAHPLGIDDYILLFITDALLDLLPRPDGNDMIDRLKDVPRLIFVRMVQESLDDARSVYGVKPDGRGLVRRVHPIAAKALASAVQAAVASPDVGSAASHLQAASDAVRALKPDCEKAYGQAIKAVESAAHAIIEPKNRKATLGSMLRVLDKNPTAFEVEIASLDRAKGPIAPVTAVMRMLWEGQTSRHGSQEPTREETLAEAEMAVQLASVLVLWFTTGKVRRRP
jgi:hypothetical protein